MRGLDCEAGENWGGGEEQCAGVMQINGRTDLGDIADLG
jgi:hypothetical protein